MFNSITNESQILLVFGSLLLIFIFIIFITSSFTGNKKKELKEQEKNLKLLSQRIETKRAELTSIESEINHKTIDRKSNLSVVVNEVLDIYEKSNIKLPIDIIEELQYMNFSYEDQVMDYIENQRNYWVLENRKKPFKGV